MDDLALAAASALMTAMATDAWSEVHAGAVGLWRRVYPDRVPAIEAELLAARDELAAARQDGDAEVGMELAGEWRRKFQRLIRENPGLIPELQMLEEAWTRLVPASGRARSGGVTIEQTAVVHGRGTTYQAGGNIYQSGRNRRITGS